MTFFSINLSSCFQQYINNVFNIVILNFLYKCTTLHSYIIKEYSQCCKHRLYSYYVT